MSKDDSNHALILIEYVHIEPLNKILFNMKRLYLMKNPELFQGEKHIKKSKNYFEGWYFKNSTDDQGISFIPGISINDGVAKSFIQIITTENSYFVEYDIEKFKFNYDEFFIEIDGNIFTKDKIQIDIQDDNQNLKISGEIEYKNNKNISTSLLSPNIMGPFSYITFMECNHAVLCMKSIANGSIDINGINLQFNDGVGYIEKDWGCSFPKTYIWCQGNDFKNNKAAFMLSVADIPFKIFSFRGIICSLIVDGKEYRFATYNNAKIVDYDIKDGSLNITLKKKHYLLNLKSMYIEGQKLLAPSDGEMSKNIFESISATIFVTLKKDNEVIFSDTSTNCGLEIV